METKHTPGPWDLHRYGDGSVLVRGTGQDHHTGHGGTEYSGERIGIAVAQGWDGVPALAEVEANARLVASAPDLLAALRGLLVQVDRRCGGRCEGNSDLARAADAARAAIAKAEGGE